MNILTCANCSKEKPESKYLADWQKRHKVCNYCKDHHGVRGAVKTKAINAAKTLPCLRCGDKFDTVKNVRICTACKLSHEFEGDKFMQFFNQTAGVIA